MKTVRQRKELVDKTDKSLSIKKQCELLSLNRSSLYYRPVEENESNLKLMRMMDEHYLEYPYFGAVRMYKCLTLDMKMNVSLNRIERLYYTVMGLHSVLVGATHLYAPKKPYRFPIFTEGLINRAPRSSLGYRHYLHPHEERVYVLNSSNRSLQ